MNPSTSPPVAHCWARFAPDSAVLSSTLPPDCRRTSYRVDSVRTVAGEIEAHFKPGTLLARFESALALVPSEQGFIGATQHVVYTDAEQRSQLLAASARESGPCAVLIPIRKSASWWSMAQDERLALFHGGRAARGHYAIGASYASRIFRRLYHARYLSGSQWDFLTYFEFPVAESEAFRSLLAELRDTASNPEWDFVEAELELWLTKLDEI